MEKTSGQLELERRRLKNQITITDFSVCYYCKSTGLKETDAFCPNCGFPQRGNEKAMRYFISNMESKKEVLANQKKAVNKARNILYILAGLNLIAGILLGLVVSQELSIFLASLIGAGIFFGLGLWSRKQPFPAILTGFFVYIVFNVMAAISDPTTIYQGLLWKILIISGFVYGYRGVKESKELEEELASIKNSKDLSSEN